MVQPTQKAPHKRGFKRRTTLKTQISDQLALTSLIAWLGLVDDINAALAANQLVVAVTLAEALKAVADFHNRILSKILCGFPLRVFHNPECVPLPAPNPQIPSPNGGRDRDRTCDPYDVNVVLYR